MTDNIIIYKTEDSIITSFAADELKKYLERLAGDKICIAIEEKRLPFNDYGGINIGLFSSLLKGMKRPFKSVSFLMEEEYSEKDDMIYINIEAGKGIIAGSNPYSVLTAVYRYLAEAGCRWVRPGEAGEYIPVRDIFQLNVSLIEKASYRHRGICIEGAVNYDNVADMIDWMPKVGLNSYFFQFMESYIFFERWYTHKGNATKNLEPFSMEKSKEFVESLRNEIEKRGIMYHAVGHGWTCEPFGIQGLSGDPVDCELPEDTIRYFAEVNGKRGLWKNTPLFSNLCYSNPEVRKRVIDSIVDYIKRNNVVDALHFWLADDYNNHCECSECRKMIPSDFYVMMLNELDELLTEMKIDTKIVFLIYLELLWVPETQYIKNQDRFILMFAPVSRRYDKSFNARKETVETVPYKRNEIILPASIEENLAYLKAWQKKFNGDSFDFDYHLIYGNYDDPGYIKISKIIYEDIKAFKDIGLNGLISCQTQRAFFPTGLPMYVLAKTLWNNNMDYELLVEDYFQHAYGKDGGLCKQYLSRLSELFDQMSISNQKKIAESDAEEYFDNIIKALDGFLPLITENISLRNFCQQKSWEYLKYHSDICRLIASILKEKAAGNTVKKNELWNDLKNYVCTNEDAVQPVLDVLQFINAMDGWINK